MQDKVVNRLAIVIVTNDQLGDLTQQLIQNDFRFTRIDSSSGLLQETANCLLIGLDSARHEILLKLIGKCCHRHRTYIPATGEITQYQGQTVMIEAEVGGATIYTVDVERFEQF